MQKPEGHDDNVWFSMPLTSFLQRDNIDLISALISLRNLVTKELKEKNSDQSIINKQNTYNIELTKILHQLENPNG